MRYPRWHLLSIVPRALTEMRRKCLFFRLSVLRRRPPCERTRPPVKLTKRAKTYLFLTSKRVQESRHALVRCFASIIFTSEECLEYRRTFWGSMERIRRARHQDLIDNFFGTKIASLSTQLIFLLAWILIFITPCLSHINPRKIMSLAYRAERKLYRSDICLDIVR